MSCIFDKLTARDDRRRRLLDRLDLLLLRLDLLQPPERDLLEMYLSYNVSIRKLARLTGRREQTLSRQLDRLIGQLNGGAWLTLMRHRGQFSRQEMELAYDRFVRQESGNSLARRHRLTVKAVRTILQGLDKKLAQINKQEIATKTQSKVRKCESVKV